ncbi:MAG: hypothetical protein PHI79_00495 [Sulfurovaceae bacterium]|nr:hypothetical protein [Sulfurovaceae bacterium]
MTIDGRPLTQGEINMLRPIFGDSINYNAVEIASNSILINGVALSIGGDVRFDPIDYQTDFSQTSIK